MTTLHKICFALWIVSLAALWWLTYDEAHSTIWTVLGIADLAIPVVFAIPPKREVNLAGAVIGLAVINTIGYGLAFHIIISVQIILFVLMYFPYKNSHSRTRA